MEWLKFFFSGSEQFVHVEGASSCKRTLITGMPQRSVIGPFGFPTYKTPLGQICSDHGVSYYLYAEDTQIYITFDPLNGGEAVAMLE